MTRYLLGRLAALGALVMGTTGFYWGLDGTTNALRWEHVAVLALTGALVVVVAGAHMAGVFRPSWAETPTREYDAVDEAFADARPTLVDLMPPPLSPAEADRVKRAIAEMETDLVGDPEIARLARCLKRRSTT